MQGRWTRNQDLESNLCRAVLRPPLMAVMQFIVPKGQWKVLRKTKLEQQVYTEPTRTHSHPQARQVNLSGNCNFIIHKIENQTRLSACFPQLESIQLRSNLHFLFLASQLHSQIELHTFCLFTSLPCLFSANFWPHKTLLEINFRGVSFSNGLSVGGEQFLATSDMLLFRKPVFPWTLPRIYFSFNYIRKRVMETVTARLLQDIYSSQLNPVLFP